jgi:hypothetical protein
VKCRLVICFFFLLSLAAEAARKPHDAKLQSSVSVIQQQLLHAKKAFFAPVRKQQHDQQPETIHRDNCNRTISQCRNSGNDNIISGHALPLALIICTRSQHTRPVLPAFSNTLTRLLLFPNHYFW